MKGWMELEILLFDVLFILLFIIIINFCPAICFFSFHLPENRVEHWKISIIPSSINWWSRRANFSCSYRLELFIHNSWCGRNLQFSNWIFWHFASSLFWWHQAGKSSLKLPEKRFPFSRMIRKFNLQFFIWRRREHKKTLLSRKLATGTEIEFSLYRKYDYYIVI